MFRDAVIDRTSPTPPCRRRRSLKVPTRPCSGCGECPRRRGRPPRPGERAPARSTASSTQKPRLYDSAAHHAARGARGRRRGSPRPGMRRRLRSDADGHPASSPAALLPHPPAASAPAASRAPIEKALVQAGLVPPGTDPARGAAAAFRQPGRAKRALRCRPAQEHRPRQPVAPGAERRSGREDRGQRGSTAPRWACCRTWASSQSPEEPKPKTDLVLQEERFCQSLPQGRRGQEVAGGRGARRRARPTPTSVDYLLEPARRQRHGAGASARDIAGKVIVNGHRRGAEDQEQEPVEAASAAQTPVGVRPRRPPRGGGAVVAPGHGGGQKGKGVMNARGLRAKEESVKSRQQSVSQHDQAAASSRAAMWRHRRDDGKKRAARAATTAAQPRTRARSLTTQRQRGPPMARRRRRGRRTWATDDLDEAKFTRPRGRRQRRGLGPLPHPRSRASRRGRRWRRSSATIARGRTAPPRHSWTPRSTAPDVRQGAAGGARRCTSWCRRPPRSDVVWRKAQENLAILVRRFRAQGAAVPHHARRRHRCARRAGVGGPQGRDLWTSRSSSAP